MFQHVGPKQTRPCTGRLHAPRQKYNNCNKRNKEIKNKVLKMSAVLRHRNRASKSEGSWCDDAFRDPCFEPGKRTSKQVRCSSNTKDENRESDSNASYKHEMMHRGATEDPKTATQISSTSGREKKQERPKNPTSAASRPQKMGGGAI